MKILLAVDGSAYTRRMLAYIAAHEEWLGPQHDYTMFHAVPMIPHRAAAFAGPATVQAFYDDDADAVFRPIRAFCAQQGMHAGFVHRVGPAASAIAALADEGRFDLIVMGSHGHGEIATLVLGSVATKVIAQSRVPVLLIR